MSSAICFNFDQSKILSSGNGLTCRKFKDSERFGHCQPARIAQADMNRYLSHIHYVPNLMLNGSYDKDYKS